MISLAHCVCSPLAYSPQSDIRFASTLPTAASSYYLSTRWARPHSCGVHRPRHGIPSTVVEIVQLSLRQIAEQHFGLYEIAHIEAFGKPTIDGGQQFTRFGAAASLIP
jgi:hypothetical protein